MSHPLLEKLAIKLDDVLETTEILRLQVDELEEKNKVLSEENALLRSRQSQWEYSLTTLLDKLEGANLEQHAVEIETDDILA
jgi:FtsZ-binding cell division protein ZapB